MIIDKNTVAQIAYRIHVNSADGELIEFADESSPRTMIFGYDKMIPGFEVNMLGKSSGDPISFTLEAGEAFGDYKSELLIDVPKQAFVVNGELREDLLFIGNEISMMDSHGNPARGKVTAVNGEKVSMDFNHPLAGKKLFISGKVMHVRPVTQEDLQPAGGCCGGGCGCGSAESEGQHDHKHAHHEGDNCQVCGNPPELQGQGIGDCRCG